MRNLMPLDLGVIQKLTIIRLGQKIAKLLFLITFILQLGLTDRNLSHAQTLNQILRSKSLSLTIWGAQLPETKSNKRPWDINSLPDSLIRIYLGERLLKQSLVVRNQIKPMWSLTVGPIPERRFYEGPIIVEVIEQDLWGEEMIDSIMIPLPTQKELAQVLSLEGQRVKPLIYQWVNTTAAHLTSPSTQAQPEVKENSSSPLKESFTSDSSTSTQTTDLSNQQARKKRKQQIQANAKRQSKASSLYRAYLKAQFSGDQLQAHRILLRLALNYSQTRHGRKARRIMLLDGR